MIKRDLRVKMDIKLTRKTSLFIFDQSDKCFELVLGIQTCESCSTNCNVLRHFNMVDVPEDCNHILSNSEWFKVISYQVMLLLFRVINLICKHSLQYREPSEFMETNTKLWCVVVSRKLDLCKINY